MAKLEKDMFDAKVTYKFEMKQGESKLEKDTSTLRAQHSAELA